MNWGNMLADRLELAVKLSGLVHSLSDCIVCLLAQLRKFDSVHFLLHNRLVTINQYLHGLRNLLVAFGSGIRQIVGKRTVII